MAALRLDRLSKGCHPDSNKLLGDVRELVAEDDHLSLAIGAGVNWDELLSGVIALSDSSGEDDDE